ncbi:MAG TPA: YceI family protein [Rhizomicrobium sp.]|jgi:polyisoprenoid-binding protein YceI|nr:YceI family protein [Rhizomicrobium sp.]
MKSALTFCAALALAATAALADPAPAPAPAPFVIPHGTQDVSKAVAGDYTLDTNHVGLLARVSHLGFSISIFRFEKVTAKLAWDPAAIAKSELSAAVETGSIASNVPGFAAELAGPKYLDAAQFPSATFVSTAFRPTDATHGKVDGKFTLKGKTVPLTFDVTLVGAGPGFAGGPVMGHVIGIHAEGFINPQDFNLGPFFKDPIQLVIDTEFDHKG